MREMIQDVQRFLKGEPKRDPYTITQMPSRETLEEFLRGMSGRPTVSFDTKRGIFERVEPKLTFNDQTQFDFVKEDDA